MKERLRVGFTIVELLLVIVVIGILASIIIVAYNGTQQRAQDAAIFSAVSNWSDILDVYQANTGSYPSISQDFVCLSPSLPAATGFVANECANDDSGWSVKTDATFNSTVSASIGALPPTVLPKIDGNYGGGFDHFRGVLYFDVLDGVNENGLMYDVNGPSCWKNDTVYYTYTTGNLQCVHIFQ